MKLGIFALFFPVIVFASNTSSYIRDITELLNSLESKDATRLPLTLKLADAYFNEALDLSGHSPLTNEETLKIIQDRKQAIVFYKEALNGLNGAFHPPTGTSASKIQFQLARLYADSGSAQLAEALFLTLSKQEALPDVQRESLLRLAEKFENHSNSKDLELAKSDYLKALTLCSGIDVCSYIHYRLAWVYQRLSKTQDALQEINLSLWDSKGHVREESLRDLIGFLGSRSDDGKNSLAEIEKLSAKLNRPELIADLSESYLAQGHRAPGTFILGFWNAKKPKLKTTVRLMEEYYGFRDWQKFDASLDLAKNLATTLASDDNNNPDVEKVLRRLTVQLDGERITQNQKTEEFKNTVMLYLQLFPNNSERSHMMDGWIAAEKDDAAKISQLKAWIDQSLQLKQTNEATRLRRLRAALAQKNQNYTVVAEEMSALQSISLSKTNDKTNDQRELQYQVAYAHYKNKNFEQSLSLFVQLADLNNKNKIDKWGLQSEHLALDILAQKKDYLAVIQQAQMWTKNENFKNWLKSPDFSKELVELSNIETSAQFEWASNLATNPTADKNQALEVFLTDCEQKILLPKSCSNAQVLAEKLGNEAALIRILNAQDKKEELAAEYEASGEFNRAADMLEKNQDDKKSSIRTKLKIALLYELGSDNANRDRILRKLVASLKGMKSLGAEENLIFATLQDANLLTQSEITLPWNNENHLYLIEYLASKNSSDLNLQTQLTKVCQDLGPAWEKAAKNELISLNEKQKKIHFFGNGSKKKFENRVAALNSLVKKADCFLQNTNPQMRVAISTLVSQSAYELANEIQSSPLPDGIDEEGKKSVLAALADMSMPFTNQGHKFKELATEQLAKITDEKSRQNLLARIEAKDDLFETNLISDPAPNLNVTSENNKNILQAAVQELHQNPNSQGSLLKLKNHYESINNTRLAAYFQGRLQQLEETKK